MARPTTRAELLQAAEAGYDTLLALIAEMSDAEREGPLSYGPGFAKSEAHWARDRTVRDVIVHLTAWHGLLRDWVVANEGGNPSPFLPSPYTWRDYAGMNVEFRDAHESTSLADALREFGDSHAAVMALIDGYTNEELFVKKFYPWTGTTSLGSYCVSATSSHYDWAVKKLRAARRGARTPG
ncbi:ClbS/DfsB family four-helix bundle protein [Leucobacter sp. NPDC015123]|uniref:ClbS/DfsB family four-helix bundle protein n=1 Tax=Leucobacter sp. NPDC015123 TaxID=3364129 RepID=UPI0036F46BED